MSAKRPAEIVDLTPKDLEQAAAVLAAAFSDDPLARYLLADLGEDYPGCLHEFFRFTCEIRLELGWPFWGVVRDGQLLGVACLSLPEPAEWPPSLSEKLQRLKTRMGATGSERLERYATIVGEYTPREPHYFFGVLGVHPSAQGQGLSSLLLRQAHALTESHPTARGIALDTQKPVNVSIYQHFGYQLTSEHRLCDEVTVYIMFRRNGPTGEK